MNVPQINLASERAASIERQKKAPKTNKDGSPRKQKDPYITIHGSARIRRDFNEFAANFTAADATWKVAEQIISAGIESDRDKAFAAACKLTGAKATDITPNAIRVMLRQTVKRSDLREGKSVTDFLGALVAVVEEYIPTESYTRARKDTDKP
jgi:hypothetical protein